MPTPFPVRTRFPHGRLFASRLRLSSPEKRLPQNQIMSAKLDTVWQASTHITPFTHIFHALSRDSRSSTVVQNLLERIAKLARYATRRPECRSDGGVFNHASPVRGVSISRV